MVDHLKKIDLVVPCAGMGSRLGFLTKKITKNMLKINGISILEHQLNKFLIHKEKIGILHFIIGYKANILKSYILSLNLPYKIKFHINKNYKKTGCAYSFLQALKYLKNDILVINSDLIFEQKIINNLFNNKKNNFVFLRKPILNKKMRAVKAIIKNNRIVKIDILNKDFNFEVVGPFKISSKSLTILKKICKKLEIDNVINLCCYTLFGKILNQIKINYNIIKDSDWYEVNTFEEYKQSFKKKIFKYK
ncbi:hypothetical protein N9324_00060 [Candidatus Pelagibacter sp.]|nr:hypothetical protein [Candidatus Pelagibacter sp.]